jgi:hypothetical protein
LEAQGLGKQGFCKKKNKVDKNVPNLQVLYAIFLATVLILPVINIPTTNMIVNNVASRAVVIFASAVRWGPKK